MLISLILILVSEQEVTLPAYVGRANYAATLGLLRRLDGALSERVHQDDGPKPVTCSNVLNVRPDGGELHIHAGQETHVRITGLTEEVSAALVAGFLDDRPGQWELDRASFRVVDVVCDPQRHRWTGRASYEELAATQLLQGEPQRQAMLEFASPTAFKSKEMTMPIPLPGLVFGSLVERWNAFSPIVLSPEMRRFGEEMVAISRFRLVSQAVEQKNAALRVGAMGEATYRSLGGDRYWLGVMQMLADFALYSGVGVQTATGMGQVRRIR
jgi:CRISPR-associated endoribonuclease Cas6